MLGIWFYSKTVKSNKIVKKLVFVFEKVLVFEQVVVFEQVLVFENILKSACLRWQTNAFYFAMVRRTDCYSIY